MHRAGAWLFLVLLLGVTIPPQVRAQGRTPSGPVGASMALLATLQEAGILPPEESPQANRVIQMVIQFQALFMKSMDAAVRQFVDEAFTAAFSGRAQDFTADFRKEGWTSQAVEAVCDHYANISAQERATLAPSFARVNMRLEHFESLCDLYGKARAVFGQQGRNIHRIFAEQRRTMPGGKRFDRKERRDGDEGVHTDQGEDGPHQGRSAIFEEARRRGAGPFLLRSAGYLPVHYDAG
jgi:hypothetical protein